MNTSDWREKHRHICELLSVHGLDALWLHHRENCLWYLGHSARGNGFSLLISPSKVWVVLDERHRDQFWIESLPGIDLHLHLCGAHSMAHSAGSEAESQVLTEFMAGKEGEKRIGTDQLNGSYAALGWELARQRLMTTLWEQSQYRALGKEVAAIVEVVARAVLPGKTEHELAAELAYRCYEAGISPVSLHVSADSQPDETYYAVPRDIPVFRHASLYLLGNRDGWRVPVTRMVTLGDPSEELDSLYAITTQIGMTFMHHTRVGQPLPRLANLAPLRANGARADMRVHCQGRFSDVRTTATDAKALAIEANQIVTCSSRFKGLRSEFTLLAGPERNELLAVTDEWPMQSIDLDGSVYLFPDILRL